ncbi:hypothetical protein D3C80_1466900 [compost metagenome]
MFVRAGSDTDGQVDHLAIAPVHTLGELQQAHPSGMHQVASLRGAVGDGNALAEEGRALRLTGLQALQVTLGDQAVGNQLVRQQAQCLGLVRGLLAHGYLPCGELEHDLLLLQCPKSGTEVIVVKFTKTASSTALHRRQPRQNIWQLKRLT